ncbi:hypothetical protein PENTCL1PPCAC_26505, partial [Pristionchus entomophagus]
LSDDQTSRPFSSTSGLPPHLVSGLQTSSSLSSSHSWSTTRPIGMAHHGRFDSPNHLPLRGHSHCTLRMPGIVSSFQILRSGSSRSRRSGSGSSLLGAVDIRPPYSGKGCDCHGIGQELALEPRIAYSPCHLSLPGCSHLATSQSQILLCIQDHLRIRHSLHWRYLPHQPSEWGQLVVSYSRPIGYCRKNRLLCIRHFHRPRFLWSSGSLQSNNLRRSIRENEETVKRSSIPLYQMNHYHTPIDYSYCICVH